MSQLTGSFSSTATLRFVNNGVSTVGSQLNWSGDFTRSHQINSATAGAANQVLILPIPGDYDLSTLTGEMWAGAGALSVANIEAGAPDKIYGVLIENMSTQEAQTLTLQPGNTNPLNLGTITVQPGGHAGLWFPTGIAVSADAKNIKFASGAIGAYGRMVILCHAEVS